MGGEPVEMHVRVEDEDSDLKTTLVMLIVAAYRDQNAQYDYTTFYVDVEEAFIL